MTPGRVLNITQGGRVIATTSRTTAANVVTVNPKTLQLTAIKGASGATGKDYYPGCAQTGKVLEFEIR